MLDQVGDCINVEVTVRLSVLEMRNGWISECSVQEHQLSVSAHEVVWTTVNPSVEVFEHRLHSGRVLVLDFDDAAGSFLLWGLAQTQMLQQRRTMRENSAYVPESDRQQWRWRTNQIVCIRHSCVLSQPDRHSELQGR